MCGLLLPFGSLPAGCAVGPGVDAGPCIPFQPLLLTATRTAAGPILFQHQSMLNAELDFCVVSGAVQNLLAVMVVDGSVVAGAALPWRSLNRIPVALIAAVGAVWVWHGLALG